MPRRPRLVLANVPLHLIQRGNNRQACFFVDEDYRVYLDWLTEYAAKAACRVHAYVLMTNHAHLVISAARSATPGELMKVLGQRYVQYINPLLPDASGAVSPCLPTLHRVEPGQGSFGGTSGRLSLVGLPL